MDQKLPTVPPHPPPPRLATPSLTNEKLVEIECNFKIENFSYFSICAFKGQYFITFVPISVVS
jgi:hypothetical protein